MKHSRWNMSKIMLAIKIIYVETENKHSKCNCFLSKFIGLAGLLFMYGLVIINVGL